MPPWARGSLPVRDAFGENIEAGRRGQGGVADQRTVRQHFAKRSQTQGSDPLDINVLLGVAHTTRAAITTQFKNEWPGKHEDHLISSVRRRYTGGFKDAEGDLLPPEAGASPMVTLSLTCLDCHTEVLLAIDDPHPVADAQA